MVMSERLKEMVVGAGARGRDRGRVAREEGMMTLREAGLAKVRAGVTSIEEVARVASVVVASQNWAQARGADGRSKPESMEASKDFDFAEVLTRMVEERASDVHLSPGFPPAIRVRGRITPLEEYGPLDPAADPRDRLQHPQRRPAQALRVEQAARPRLRDPGRRPLPRQLLLPARRDQRRLPPHPARDPDARRARRCRRCSRSSPGSRAASCSSPGRPARARRPRSRRWST